MPVSISLMSDRPETNPWPCFLLVVTTLSELLSSLSVKKKKDKIKTINKEKVNVVSVGWERSWLVTKCSQNISFVSSSSPLFCSPFVLRPSCFLFSTKQCFPASALIFLKTFLFPASPEPVLLLTQINDEEFCFFYLLVSF